jgi:GTP-dependent phosphoenolpyruvate carboxykinase
LNGSYPEAKEEIDAEKTPIGYIPKKGDIDLSGLDVSDEEMDELFVIDKKDWLKRIEGIKEPFIANLVTDYHKN